MPQGIPSFRRAMVELQGDAGKHLTPFMRTQIVEIDAEFRTRSDRLGQLEKQFVGQLEFL